MFNRYSAIQQIDNNSEQYLDLLKNKKLKSLVQYSTFSFGRLNEVKNSNLERVLHIVQPFEKLYNISQKYYNSPEYGWIICYLNNIPNELHIYEGKSLIIYLPIELVLGYL